jgi:hypothetical protein
MKIRIKGNSLRFRLSRPEVKKFSESGFLEERVHFTGNALIYRVEKTDEHEFSADFIENSICLYFPQRLLKEWIETDRTGFEYLQRITGQELLHLLIEKDFTCLEKTAEDQHDQYPNPLLKSLEAHERK